MDSRSRVGFRDCAECQDSYVKMLRNETFDDTVKNGKWVVVFQNVALDCVAGHE